MIKKLHFLFIFFFSLNFNFLSAQTDTSSATNPSEEIEKERNWKFVFSFDARRSWVLDQSVKFNGFKIGAEYKNIHRFGLGFYSLQQPIRFPNNLVAVQNPDSGTLEIDTVDYVFNFSYSTLYYEWVFYEKKRWEFSSAFHLGTGRVNIGYIDKYNRDSTLNNFRVPIGAVSVSGHYKVFPWIGIGGGVGYRFAIVGNKQVTQALNGFHTIFKVKLFLGDLYRGCFKRKKGYRLTYKKCEVCL